MLGLGKQKGQTRLFCCYAVNLTKAFWIILIQARRSSYKTARTGTSAGSGTGHRSGAIVRRIRAP